MNEKKGNSAMSIASQSASGGTALRGTRKPIMLVAGLLAAGFIALSIHVVMLASGVPFPLPQAPMWARWLNLSFVASGTLVFLTYATPAFNHQTLMRRTLIVFAVLATLQETLRGVIMTFVVTGGWIQPAVGALGLFGRTLVVALLCSLTIRWVRGRLLLLAVAPVVAAIASMASIGLESGLAPVMRYASGFARDDLYQFPYPFHVTVAAYLTFLEAVAGATLMTMLIWHQLPASRAIRLLLLAVLAASMKGVLGGTVVYGFFTGPSILIGMLSWSQFLFEFLALGALVGLVWEISFGPPLAPSRLPGETMG